MSRDAARLAEVQPVGAVDPGPRPELRWLAVDRLTVDNRYQRTLESRRSQALILRIADGFRWSAFQAILAVTANVEGFHLVIDGQHRVEAARRLGLVQVPAVIVGAVGIEEQARAFVRANTDRVAVNAFALYHARLAAGDPSATATEALCRAAGIALPRYPIPADKLQPGQTLALTLIEKLPAKVGDQIARQALKLVAAAYARQTGALRAAIIQAVATLLLESDAGARAATIERLRAALDRRSAEALRQKAARKRFRWGGTEASCVKAQIEEDMRHAVVLPLAVAGSSIGAPSRERLMGRR